MEVAPDESIDISIIAKDGIASYKIQEDGSALLVKERFDALDEIYDFEFTTPEMDSIRKAIRRLEDLSVPKSEANVDANNYAIIIKTADADIKLYTNKKDSNAINNFTDNLDKYFLSSKSIEVFKSREGLVYPPPPPMSDRMIDEVKFVNPSSGN
ncbi:MAG: hypothetical protein PSV16_15075 [Flavobacterium sp.]|nr:hypothetical protein [Flavobacterium sp.]